HGGARPAKKSTWGALKGRWVPHDSRDQVVDFVHRWSGKTGIAVCSFLLWLGRATSKWHNWRKRYGQANEHNARIPRDHWLEPEEKLAILDFQAQSPPRGLPPPALPDARPRRRRLQPRQRLPRPQGRRLPRPARAQTLRQGQGLPAARAA